MSNLRLVDWALKHVGDVVVIAGAVGGWLVGGVSLIRSRETRAYERWVTAVIQILSEAAIERSKERDYPGPMPKVNLRTGTVRDAHQDAKEYECVVDETALKRVLSEKRRHMFAARAVHDGYLRWYKQGIEVGLPGDRD